MLRKHLFKTAFSFFALIAAASAAVAQSPSATPPPDDDEPIRIDSRLIVVPVSVVDANGQPVTGLTQADFQISEEGRRQQIESVGSADSVPLDIALLFDVSASTDAMFRFQQETAVKFLKDVLRAEDRAAIFTIGEKALLVSGLAQAGPATESVLAIPVERAKQPTAFFDSVRAAADYLRENSQSGRRRVIVVISDGEDNFSLGVQRAQRTAERRVVENRCEMKIAMRPSASRLMRAKRSYSASASSADVGSSRIRICASRMKAREGPMRCHLPPGS
ncbi:MAG TPA: VWA domain-containing protein [Pyrinomonadaceae bacterium]|nr:VWA domain-containing protein [Pyrinomonadaceae bacterium]